MSSSGVEVGGELKSWSYEEITAKVEDKIRRFMEKSRMAKDARDRDMFRDWAYGVFAVWYSLAGVAGSEDDIRLEALLKA